jgi:diadenosine tetraphosphate (Ap4A) HIT family hydrolase
MAKGDAAVTDPGCKACTGAWPLSDHFISDFGLSKAYLHDDQFFSGWTVVVFKRHATELFHLAPTERIQLMEEVNLVAKVLAEVFHAKKMNYELLGNQLPHIHWHLVPRAAHDPAPLSPVWLVQHEARTLDTAALNDRIALIRSALKHEQAGRGRPSP